MSESPIRAAVLVPLVPSEAGVEVVLTLRTEFLPTHKGQVAFPGGRFDASRDESLLDTALRESEEEIGLHRRDVEIVGSLPDVGTMSSRFVITPFVARIPPHYPFVPDPGEVAEVFVMPLSAHGDPTLRRGFPWMVNGVHVEAEAIHYTGRVVWGATLCIIDSLVASGLVATRRDGSD